MSMNRSDYLSGGTLSAAPGDAVNNAVAPNRVKLVVRVRDRSGMPLQGARVTATINDAPVNQAADAQGRVELDVPAGTGTVKADFDLARDAQPAVAPRPFPASPWPVFLADSQPVTVTGGSTFVLTLMPDVSHTPRHKYQWQNPFLRRTLYHAAGGTDTAGASTTASATPAAKAPPPPRTRNTLLAFFLSTYGQILDQQQKSGGHVQLQSDTAKLSSSFGDDHTGLMKQVFALFARDQDASVIPPWLRYIIVHFSGFRYNAGTGTSAHNTYQRPQTYVGRLRQADLHTELDGVSADQLLEICEELAQALPLPDPKAKTVSPHFNAFEAKLRTGSDIASAPGGRGAKALVQALRDPAYKGSRADLIKCVAGGLSWVFAEALSDEQAQGILLARLALQKPNEDGLWARVVGRTRLRYDVTSADWNSFEQGKPALPANKSPYYAAGGSTEMAAWKSVQQATLDPVCASAVCNQIVEQASAARGVPLPGGIPQNSRVCVLGARPTLPPPPPPSPATPADAGTTPASTTSGDATSGDAGTTTDTSSSTAAPPTPAGPPPEDAGFRLFRIRNATDLANVAPGSLVFFVGWGAIKPMDQMTEYGVRGTDIAFMENFRVRSVRKWRRWEELSDKDWRKGKKPPADPDKLFLDPDSGTPPVTLNLDGLSFVTNDNLSPRVGTKNDNHTNAPESDSLTVTGSDLGIFKLLLSFPPPKSGTPQPDTFLLVRRETDRDTDCTQYFCFIHIAIAVRPLGGDALLTFETAPGPTGLAVRTLADMTGPATFVATPPKASLLPHEGTADPAPDALRPELYGFPFVPRPDSLTTQDTPGGMLYVGNPPSQPGPYDGDS
jgi:hypothetical protein